MNPYRVPGDPVVEGPSIQKEGFFQRFLSVGCHACRFVVGYDGSARSEYLCFRKGSSICAREEATKQIICPYYVCEICGCTWGKVVYP